MQVSVIILNYNVRFFLEQCLLSVEKALEGIDGEIIVVDNDSADDSCAMVLSKFPNVKLIANNENLGFPKGNNIGVKQAKGEFIYILNPDTVIAEDSISKLLNFSLSTPNIGIVACRMIDGKGNFLPESKRGVPTPWVAFSKVFGLYKLFPNWKLFNQYYLSDLPDHFTAKVEILTGANMFMSRKLYLKVGGFDEGCFVYSDDIDLSYTVLNLGLDNYFFADTTIIHYKGESTVKDRLYMKRFREAMQFFYKKHFRPSRFFDIMMRFGTFVFVLLKPKGEKQKYFADEYIVISKKIFLQQKISNFFKKNTITITKIDENKLFSQLISPKRKVEIIFDNDFFDFKTIISAMQQHSNKYVSFKIKPKSCDYIIGSNSSNDRGEVIEMK